MYPFLVEAQVPICAGEASQRTSDPMITPPFSLELEDVAKEALAFCVAPNQIEHLCKLE